MLVSSPTTTATTGVPSATLSCELYGYLTRQPPTITWNFGNDVLMNDSVFTITVMDGSHMIQNGGDTPRPSMRSVLTINRPNRTHDGSYICSVCGGLRMITLQVMEGRPIWILQHCNIAYSICISYTKFYPRTCYEARTQKDRIMLLYLFHQF